MPKTEFGNGLSIGSDSILLPKVNFKVNQYAVLFSSIASELRARGSVVQDPSSEARLREAGLLNNNWIKRISKFAREHKADFVTSKLFSRVDVLDALIPFAEKLGTQEFDSKARSRLEYGLDMTEDEIEATMRIITPENMQTLIDTPEFSSILMDTNAYRRKVESDWHRSSNENLRRIYELVGVSEIEAYGKDKAKADALTVLIMPPTQRIQRVADKTKKEVVYCLSIPGVNSPHKTAYTNGAILNALVGDVILPSSGLTSEQSRKQKAYVGYLSVKNTGVSTERHTSVFDYLVPQEDVELMGKLYPAFLAYKYRTASREEAVKGITAELQRDIQGFERIQNPDVKSKMSAYRLNELSPDAMAGLFRGKYMGARSFADINLEELGKRVYVMPADRIKNAEEREERIH